MAYCMRLKNIFCLNKIAALRPFDRLKAQEPRDYRWMTIRWLTVRKYPVSSVKVRR